MNRKLELWKGFCQEYMSNSWKVPLFNTGQDKTVSLISYGLDKRLILERSASMERLVIEQVTLVLNDFYEREDIYEGLIYMIYYENNNLAVPLYIGKSEKYGKQGNNLSINIKNIDRNQNKEKFCRWGSSYYYHIGDLSAVVCPNHSPAKIQRKYQRWAKLLFEEYPSLTPRLKQEVYFWIYAWKKGSCGIFPELGGTSLTALEYQLIAIADELFPEFILNEEGVNRGKQFIWLILLEIYSKILHEYLMNSG
ncbi:MAG: hypothetical protein ACRCU2_06520 [Planktothrix sp.]